jgi:hypothetical protein
LLVIFAVVFIETDIIKELTDSHVGLEMSMQNKGEMNIKRNVIH